MAKLTRSPKNLELDINVAKKQAIPHFLWKAANSAANGKFHGVKICMPRNPALPIASHQGRNYRDGCCRIRCRSDALPVTQPTALKH